MTVSNFNIKKPKTGFNGMVHFSLVDKFKTKSKSLLLNKKKLREVLIKCTNEWNLSCIERLRLGSTESVNWLLSAACYINHKSPSDITSLCINELPHDSVKKVNKTVKSVIDRFLQETKLKAQMRLF